MYGAPSIGMLAKAASPRECSLGLVLHLPPAFGGYGLPQPLLNEPIDLAEADKRLADRSHYVADLLWQKQQVIVEYDSDAFHLTSASRHHDSVRRAVLENAGYRVINITRNHLASIDEMNRAAATIARALKHPLRFRVPRLRAAPSTTPDNPGPRRSVKQSMARLRAQARHENREACCQAEAER